MAIRIAVIAGQATLASWAAQPRKVRTRRFTTSADGLRFAFYGRMSTIDFHDRASSCRGRRDYAQDLVAVMVRYPEPMQRMVNRLPSTPSDIHGATRARAQLQCRSGT